MEFFLDTGDINEIKEAYAWGIVDGVTTNPSIIAKTGKSQKEIIEQISKIVEGPVSAEVISTDFKGMVSEAETLSKIHPNVVVKLPLTESGIQACQWCTNNRIQTNVTLCFSPMQALLAAKNGATYISPFIGRLDDVGQDGMSLIQEIRQIYDNYGFTTKILAASIRNVPHVRDAAFIGADVGTMPFSIMKQLFQHQLTTIGLEKFLKDHRESLK